MSAQSPGSIQTRLTPASIPASKQQGWGMPLSPPATGLRAAAPSSVAPGSLLLHKGWARHRHFTGISKAPHQAREGDGTQSRQALGEGQGCAVLGEGHGNSWAKADAGCSLPPRGFRAFLQPASDLRRTPPDFRLVLAQGPGAAAHAQPPRPRVGQQMGLWAGDKPWLGSSADGSLRRTGVMATAA